MAGRKAWCQSRRKWCKLASGLGCRHGEIIAHTATIEQMGKLWAVEENVRGQSPQARMAARQETSAAVVADLFKLWQDTLPRISGKSKLADAIRYALARRTAFERFLADGRIEIDSNIVERAIRPQAIIRKNSLFAGSAGGGRT